MDQRPTIVEAASDVKRARARRLSRTVFGGAAYRLEVGAAVADRGLVSTAELADALGLAKQSVNQELLRLEVAGLVTREDMKGREVYFRRVDSSYYAFCLEAFGNAGEMLARSAVP